MRLLGYDISVRKAARQALSGVDDSRGWTRIFDWHTGAWQQHAEAEITDVHAQVWVFACITLIASDIGKLRLRLVEKKGRIWSETDSPAYSPVLRKPNHYQTRQKFVESWIVSKLSHGNTYALKQRDGSNNVKSLYVLDPTRCQPLIAPDGSVYYRLGEDDLNKLPVGLEAIPASEIIHDRMVCLFHPLVGVSPLYAAMLPAMQALKIQTKSKKFFENNSQPGGILSAPARINEETAKRIKDYWDRNYTGENAGKVAVLGDGLTFTAGSVNAVDSQLIEQLGMTAKQICSAFHVPPFMVGAADAPPYGNIGPAVQQYYNQCLQSLIESFEASMDQGLGIGEGVKIESRELGVELDLDALLRMDKKSQAEVEGMLVQRGITAPDESREVFGLPPVTGGDTPYLQQQNYGLAALSRRDRQEDPFGTTAPAPAAPAPSEEDAREEMRAAVGHIAGAVANIKDLAAGLQEQRAEVESEKLVAALILRISAETADVARD
jgi:HK97 family phage portal protein